jgi:uncharacterized protein YecE (DUF72 family)
MDSIMAGTVNQSTRAPLAAVSPLRALASVRVGPAGWSYNDWAGIVYPHSRPRGFHEAEYLARFFDTIEINTSFYQPVRAELAKSWVTRVRANPRFRFTAKLYKRFTHERDAGREDEKAVKRGLQPLAEAGRLGALLMQFPWSFKWSRENREYIGSLVMQFLEFPLVLEVRHNCWNRPEMFDLLGNLGVGFCNIDQPLIGRSLEPTAEATGPVGYIRLHGRNYDQWFAHSEPQERYNYLYSVDELEPWVARVRRVAEHAQATFVITNNHFEGKGVANAIEIEHLLGGEPVPAPDTLTAHYPELSGIALPESAVLSGRGAVGQAAVQQSDFSFDAPVPPASRS